MRRPAARAQRGWKPEQQLGTAHWMHAPCFCLHRLQSSASRPCRTERDQTPWQTPHANAISPMPPARRATAGQALFDGLRDIRGRQSSNSAGTQLAQHNVMRQAGGCTLVTLFTPSTSCSSVVIVSGVHSAQARCAQRPQVVRFMTPFCTGHSAHAGHLGGPAHALACHRSRQKCSSLVLCRCSGRAVQTPFCTGHSAHGSRLGGPARAHMLSSSRLPASFR